jgi:hypothetical protein
MLDNRRESLVGDVASFYLPYAEHAIRLRPDSRLIVLKRRWQQFSDRWAEGRGFRKYFGFLQLWHICLPNHF